MTADHLAAYLLGLITAAVASTFSDGLPNTARWLALRLRTWALKRDLYRARRAGELERAERVDVTIPEKHTYAEEFGSKGERAS